MALQDIRNHKVEKIIIPAIADDGSFYPIEKMQAHREAVLHLAVSVFVFDVGSGDLLIQQRATEKYHCGGLWANTCCTHPHWDETLASSASRRLREELGFSVPLSERRVFQYSADCGNGLHENERVTFYVGYVDKSNLAVDLNPDEVAAVDWVHPKRLSAMLADDPSRLTPWFQIYLKAFPGLRV